MLCGVCLKCMFLCGFPLDVGIVLCVSFALIHPPNVGWYIMCLILFAI